MMVPTRKLTDKEIYLATTYPLAYPELAQLLDTSKVDAVQSIVTPRTSQGNFVRWPRISLISMISVRKKLKTHATPPAPCPGKPVVPIMQYRLRNCLPFWKTFTRSTLVLTWIASGFDFRWLPSTGPPPAPHFSPNRPSLLPHASFAWETVTSLRMPISLLRILAVSTALPHGPWPSKPYLAMYGMNTVQIVHRCIVAAD
jgi:hypothetical protein